PGFPALLACHLPVTDGPRAVMSHRHRWFCAIVPFVASSLIAAQAMAADAIRLRMDWTPWGDQAPFHLAQERGLFKKYGLEVSVDDGNGSVATVQIVGNGEYDVGHASLAPMAIA